MNYLLYLPIHAIQDTFDSINHFSADRIIKYLCMFDLMNKVYTWFVHFAIFGNPYLSFANSRFLIELF